jgi:carboxypeptidase C (cathepsin A)
MKTIVLMAAALCLLGQGAPAAIKSAKATISDAVATIPAEDGALFTPESASSQGSIMVEGKRVDYTAVAGTIVVHPKGWDDAASRESSDKENQDKGSDEKTSDERDNPRSEASIFYVAYFRKGVPANSRPVTFLYNGGPGSSTVWLHMGAFGPKRVVTKDDSHSPAAPYTLVDNAYSLLDVSDLVFIDAPGTGFSRIAGKDKEKAFLGVDADAHAFGQFIMGFLSKYGRWNSPKYLFGESYGTPRSAVLVNDLESEESIDVNGVILLSQILNFDLSVDGPEFNPGSDEAYITALPTYAATACYYNRLHGQRPENLQDFLRQAEGFATTEYASALQAGSELDATHKEAIARRFSDLTGLPTAYVLKSNLRINGGQFEKMLQDSEGLTTGRLDSRFSGPDLDPLSKEAEYDPQASALGSAYVSAFNDYVRKQLGFGQGKNYKPEIDVEKDWDFQHEPPGLAYAVPGVINVMPDLAAAMKTNPGLKIMVNGGYYDLATPFYEGWYEMHHLPIPASLQSNIEYAYYQSGHMVYAHEAALKELHDNVAGFIGRTDNLSH